MPSSPPPPQRSPPAPPIASRGVRDVDKPPTKGERLIRYPTASNALRSLLEGNRPAEDSPKPSPGRADRLLTFNYDKLLDAAGKPRQLILKAPPAPTRRPTPPHASADAMRVTMGELHDVAALGDLMRLRRQSLRLTQQQLADRANVGRRFISEVEAGKPTVEFGKVLAVCHALGLVLIAAS